MIDPGGVTTPMVHVAGDHWQCNYVAGGETHLVDVSCGAEVPGCTSMSVIGTRKARIYNQAVDLTSATHTYRFFTYANCPDSWPGGYFKFQLVGSSPPTLLSGFQGQGLGPASLTMPLSSSWTGLRPLLYVVIQFGTDASGGVLADPPVLSGATIKLSTAAHNITVIYHPGIAYPGTNITIPLSTVSDLTAVAGAIIGGTFSGTLAENTSLHNQPATLNPAITVASAAHTPCVQLYSLFQHRALLTNIVLSAPTTWTAMSMQWWMRALNTVGGTPIYEGISFGGGISISPPTPNTAYTIHCPQSLGFDGVAANFY
jgi:hypothetical protein